MKIADGILLMRDIADEMGRLKSLANKDSWEFRTVEKDAKWQPSFDIEENHKKVKELSKKHRRISRAISLTNNQVDLLGIKDEDYADWL